jgi:CHAT domain-containing protein
MTYFLAASVRRVRALLLAALLLALHTFPAAAQVPAPKIGPLPETVLGDAELALELKPPAARAANLRAAMASKKVGVPKAGEKNGYGVIVTPAMADANAAHFRQDTDAALAALARADAETKDSFGRWQAAFLRCQVLIMAGRAADAEGEFAETARREIAHFGNDLNTRALRGEAYLWLGDFAAARQDYARVWNALRDWRLPTSYFALPSNLIEIIALTAAQLRAMTGLAGLYLLAGDSGAALPWAEEAELRYDDVHYLANHLLYGSYIPAHADSYYGRASNLVFLGAARIAVKRDAAAGEPAFAAAQGFYDVGGYPTGKVNLLALKTYALDAAGLGAAALATADAASELAAKAGLGDLLWRIETGRGKLLLQQGKIAEAEAALQRAQVGVEAVQGTLVSDRAKLRFGTSKEDIGYYLAQVHAGRGDLPSLFRDLERSRARAFVDMLAGRAVATGRQAELTSTIRELDRALSAQALRNAAPGGATPQGLQTQEELAQRRRQAIKLLRERDPELADVFAVSAAALESVQAQLKPGEVLVYGLPARSKDRLRLLLVQGGGVRLLQLELTAQALRSKLRQLRTAVRAQAGSEQQQTAAEIRAALQTGTWGARSGLYVVPSGELYSVPWGTLALEVPVAVLPTGGWLLRGKQSLPAGSAAVVGDPEFGGALPPLAGARKEAEAVAGIYGTSALLGAAATEVALRDRIGAGVGMLHLATHGEFDPDQPLRSALYLTRDGKAAALTAADIFARPLPARLVVLSACETGVGEVTAGDDFLGLPRSFYLGGARALVYSLWPVDDAGTQAFMRTFQSQARDGDYGKAWLKARDELKQGGAQPWIYGAFVLGGALRE